MIKGTVLKRFKNGRKIGFPTANIDSELDIGVYTAVTVINDVQYGCIVAVGNPPTTETHIIGYDKFDLYGKELKLTKIKKVPIFLTDKNCLLNRDATEVKDLAQVALLAQARGKKRKRQLEEQKFARMNKEYEEATKRMPDIVKYGLKAVKEKTNE